MRQGVVLPETPRDRRNLQGLEQDMRDNPLAGKTSHSGCATSARMSPATSPRSAGRGRTWPAARDRGADGRARTGARGGVRGAGRRPSAWRELAERWDFSEVNDLIDRHNRWYPAEARLPMDPMTGDHALVNGEHYSKRPLDATWVLDGSRLRLSRDVAASVSAQSAAAST